jgi:hypothetical protein
MIRHNSIGAHEPVQYVGALSHERALAQLTQEITSLGKSPHLASVDSFFWVAEQEWAPHGEDCPKETQGHFGGS